MELFENLSVRDVLALGFLFATVESISSAVFSFIKGRLYRKDNDVALLDNGDTFGSNGSI